jgi:hypothetical protein
MKKIIVILIIIVQATLAFAQDSLKVLCIGNSFTYVCVSHEKLKEIACSEGHLTSVTACYAGGYSFKRHLCNANTLKAVETGRYDVVFLQNQTMLPALYANDSKLFKFAKTDAQELAQRVHAFSPDAKVWLEQTWTYKKNNWAGFGSWDNFETLNLEGTKKIMTAMSRAMYKGKMAGISPIGEAFAVVRQERSDINLYAEDKKHQNDFGSYLKACVNYLIIYGGKFDDKASTCGLDPTICKYLQSVAERVVNKIL